MDIKCVLVSDDLDEIGITLLDEKNVQVDIKTELSKSQLIEEIKNYDALIVRSRTQVTADIIEAGTRLKVIGRAGVGVDNIDVAAATNKGILVINAPGGNTIAAAELTCLMITALSRHLVRACSTLKNGTWDKKTFMGTELMNKTLAIIGLGRIGREVARRMQAFGMRTIGYDPIVSPEVAASFGVEFMEMDRMWPQADFITFHVPLLNSTKYLINRDVLSQCKRGVKIINCSRGGIINEAHLLEALTSGVCGGAGLDVYEEEPCKNHALLNHPSVICTPHLGASTTEAQVKVAEEISLQFLDLIDGKSVPGAINQNQLKS